jgi:hypothetical protein
VQPGLDDDGLILYLTAGALAQIGRDIEEPSVADEEWLGSLDEWFAEIGRAVYAVAPFEVATIGHTRCSASIQPRRFDRIAAATSNGHCPHI